MLITAKLTKLNCFVNSVLQPFLILDKIILCRLRPFTDSAHITFRVWGNLRPFCPVSF